MKTEFLKALGLEQEQIDKIMAGTASKLLRRKPKNIWTSHVDRL